jgi:hypothetical protein
MIHFEIRARAPLADGRGNWKAALSGYFKSANSIIRLARSPYCRCRLSNWTGSIQFGLARPSLAGKRRRPTPVLRLK